MCCCISKSIPDIHLHLIRYNKIKSKNKFKDSKRGLICHIFPFFNSKDYIYLIAFLLTLTPQNVLPMITQENQLFSFQRAPVEFDMCALDGGGIWGWKRMKGQEKFKEKTTSLNTCVFMDFGNTELTTET